MSAKRNSPHPEETPMPPAVTGEELVARLQTLFQALPALAKLPVMLSRDPEGNGAARLAADGIGTGAVKDNGIYGCELILAPDNCLLLWPLT